MKPIVRSIFVAAASALCLNFSGCAVAISKDGVLLVVGGDVSPLQKLAEQQNAISAGATTSTPALTEEARYVQTRNRDPLYKDGLLALRDVTNNALPDDYDQLKKTLKNLAAIANHPSYFPDALMASGLMEKFDPEQAVEDQFGNAVTNYVGMFLEQEMATTLIALTENNDTDIAHIICEHDRKMIEDLRNDFGIIAAEVLDKRITPALRDNYRDACRTFVGRDNLLVHTRT